MRKFLIMALAGFFVTATAHAATCEEQAAKSSFVKKCVKTAAN